MELIYLFIGLLIGILIAWLFIRAKYGNVLSSKSQVEEMNTTINSLNTELSLTHDRLKRNDELIQRLQQDVAKKEEDQLSTISQLSMYQTRYQSANEQAEQIRTDREAIKNELNKQSELLNQSRIRAIELEKENKYLQEALEKQKKDLEEIGNQFSKEFRLLADQILEDKSQRFTKINQDNIDRLLKPLDENIKQFQKQVQEVYEKESRERFSLGEKVKELSELNQTISKEAKNLTEALKGQVKTQGNWGEMILESILNKSGLVKGREYTTQESLKDEEGKRFQPDVIISYPDKRKVVIDSKVSLIAYDRYCTATNSDEQKKAIDELLRSLRNHVDGLSGKNYSDLVGSLDFVMMFIPIEPAFMIAMEADHDIWTYAYNKRVLLISPTNLIAALKLIYDLWQHEYRNQNALEIAKRGGQLYDKFVNFVENFKSVGDSLSKAQKTYDSAFNQLKDGRGSLITQAQQLKELGVKASKSIPEDMTNGVD
ncbi:DNA recombination protein RmuC [Tenuifilaceae bacterium CYCD]|nr:DNA recombination protein RmuC [Tenuifilaceae bacterium CYCD]